MRVIAKLVAALTLFAATSHGPARAQTGTIYLVSYFEIAPTEGATAASVLETYRDSGRKTTGNLRFDVLHEMGRPDRFAIIEAWQDRAALDDRKASPGTAEFRDTFKKIQVAPPDERLLGGLRVSPTKSEHRPGMIYVLTHVDVAPPFADNAATLLSAMFDDTIKENGNLGYEVLRQANRMNHFTVVEEWASMSALGDHVMAAHTREFREKLSPMIGALYDERLYTAD
jgi:quinol monooxygenase YgiN